MARAVNHPIESGIVSCCAFLIELKGLTGRDRLISPVISLNPYD